MKQRGEVRATPTDAPIFEPTEAFWARATIASARPERKVSLHLRIDPEVLAFFKSEGPGHLTRMAEVLKLYARAKAASPRKP